jgi:4'-phosphopantetheinyl transferase
MSSKWSVIDALPLLEDEEVHLWRIELAGAESLIDRYTSLLSVAERAQARRLRSGLARDHFTIGRACLRVLLGNALGISPRDVSITKGAHGKPETPPVARRSVSFNVAHSKGTVLIALGHQSPVGVDVEYLDRLTDIMEVARANFTENESNILAAISEPDTRLRTFYRYWTRKEAIVKADGRGLLLPLASFDVSLESMDAQPVRVNETSDADGKLYFVTDLDLGDKAVAALALESSRPRVSRFLFPLGSSHAAQAEQ